MKRNLYLQLFAEAAVSHDYTNKTTSNTTGNNLSAENKTFYEKKLIETADPELIFDQFADKYPIPKNGGKTIEFRQFSPLPSVVSDTKLVEGVTPKGNKLNVSAITATVEQMGDYVEISDMAQTTALDPMIIQATSIIGSQAGRVLNKVTREKISGGTNVRYAPKSDGTAITSRTTLDKTCTISLKLLRAVANDLKRNNAPKIDGYYIGIIHPDVATGIMNLDGWTDINKYKNPEAIYKGEIGSIAGIRFIENTEAKIMKDGICPALTYKETTDTTPQSGKAYYTKSNSTYTLFTDASFTSGTTYYEGATFNAVYFSYFVAKGAYATTEVEGGGLQHIIKPLGSGDDPLNQRGTVGWKATKCAEILVEQYLERVESCTDISDTAAVTAN